MPLWKPPPRVQGRARSSVDVREVPVSITGIPPFRTFFFAFSFPPPPPSGPPSLWTPLPPVAPGFLRGFFGGPLPLPLISR